MISWHNKLLTLAQFNELLLTSVIIPSTHKGSTSGKRAANSTTPPLNPGKARGLNKKKFIRAASAVGLFNTGITVLVLD